MPTLQIGSKGGIRVRYSTAELPRSNICILVILNWLKIPVIVQLNECLQESGVTGLISLNLVVHIYYGDIEIVKVLAQK